MSRGRDGTLFIALVFQAENARATNHGKQRLGSHHSRHDTPADAVATDAAIVKSNCTKDLRPVFPVSCIHALHYAVLNCAGAVHHHGRLRVPEGFGVH